MQMPVRKNLIIQSMCSAVAGWNTPVRALWPWNWRMRMGIILMRVKKERVRMMVAFFQAAFMQ